MTTDALPNTVMPQTRTPIVWPWWIAALTYYVICCLMHLRFSIWLVRQRVTQSGQMAYSDFVPGLAIAAGIGLILWIAFRLHHSQRPRLTLAYWLLWLAAAGLIDQYLTFSINEYAHYPQYALLALLLARAMDPLRERWLVGSVLFWTTLAGAGDELSQYLWITTSYSEYLDFNDFLSNLVAAAAGLLLYYGPAAAPPKSTACRKPVAELVVTGAIMLALLVGFQTGRLGYSRAEKVPPGGIVQLADGSHKLYLQRGPDFYGSWPTGPRHGRYHVMQPASALLIMLLVGLTFTSYGRFRSFSANQTSARFC
jgi:hypothetical protein